METVDSVVVGAGVVGLAVARALARAGREVLLLEAADTIGSATSARNSEVIHAGLYYEPGSLKARLCVAGKAMLYAYAAERGVPHRRCGKLIVATGQGAPAGHGPVDAGDTVREGAHDGAHEGADGLARIQARAAACGVHDLVRLDGAAAQRLEPALRCHAALHSPSTGIVDSHALMLALRGEAEDHGAMLALRSPLQGARALGAQAVGGFELQVGGAEPMALHARRLVNCAGLHAQTVAASIEGLDPAQVPPSFWARGHYFALPGRAAFGRLIYPLPVPGGLGTHLTLDLGGQMRFGPDVQWVPTTALGAEDYRVDPALAAGFEAGIRAWWPALPAGALQPAYAGLRPKIVGPDASAADFRIDGAAVHGLPGLVNLFGIESPGLTASLAIGEFVAALLAQDGGA